MSSQKILPSEHYQNCAREIVKELCPNISTAFEFAAKMRWVEIRILQAVLDEPLVTQKKNNQS